MRRRVRGVFWSSKRRHFRESESLFWKESLWNIFYPDDRRLKFSARTLYVLLIQYQRMHFVSQIPLFWYHFWRNKCTKLIEWWCWLPKKVLLSTSSRVIQWGAYFSAVCGWKSIPFSAPELYEHQECNGVLVFHPSATFLLLLTHTQLPLLRRHVQKQVTWICLWLASEQK